MNIIEIKEGVIGLVSKHKSVSIIISLIVIIIVICVIASFASDGRELDQSAGIGDIKSQPNTPKEANDGEYDISEAIDHVGEVAAVSGTVLNVFTSKTGTVFFDFCESFQTCPFSAVIFASDVEKFKDLDQYKRDVKLTGLIKYYQGRAEMVLNSPDQIE